jgi:hypothetical protein
MKRGELILTRRPEISGTVTALMNIISVIDSGWTLGGGWLLLAVAPDRPNGVHADVKLIGIIVISPCMRWEYLGEPPGSPTLV